MNNFRVAYATIPMWHSYCTATQDLGRGFCGQLIHLPLDWRVLLIYTSDPNASQGSNISLSLYRSHDDSVR